MNGRIEREPVPLTRLSGFSLADICRDRLEGWAKELAANNCTPVLVLGIGHEQHAGEVHLFTMLNFSDADLQMFLVLAQRELRKRGPAA